MVNSEFAKIMLAVKDYFIITVLQKTILETYNKFSKEHCLIYQN